MAEGVRKFISRAPRYVLRPQDRHIMRFSLQETRGAGGIEHTILLNLSETGAAFLADQGTEFKVGEQIKVEIPIPGGDQIAWFARVVRIQEYEPRTWLFGQDPFADQGKHLIALTFEDLPEPHSRAIRKGIEDSFLKAMREQQYRNWFYYRAYILHNLWQFIAYITLTILALGFIYYFSRPSENYDSKRGAPWGQRFKF
ncbi:MAG: PilZ domain-containing protein [Bdellovibrionales bacterium]